MKLFVICGNGGDGSTYPNFVLDEALIERLDEYSLSDEVSDWFLETYCDGDGFHYTTINVPDGSTAESLGVSIMTAEDFFYDDEI